MLQIKLLLEYNGARFNGWQEQPDQRTIQGELKKALRTVLREDIPSVVASGRTDSGVHARGQVAVFRCEKKPDFDRMINGVSSILKNEVSILDAELVDENFHPIRDSKLKHYRYTIYTHPAPPVLKAGQVWHLWRELDLDLMNKEAAELVGEHDFSSFRCSGCASPSPIKNLFRSEVSIDGSYLYYDVVGSGFLKQMVRVIVGTLVERAQQGSKLAPIVDIITAKDREAAGQTAPGHGLCLMSVSY